MEMKILTNVEQLNQAIEQAAKHDFKWCIFVFVLNSLSILQCLKIQAKSRKGKEWKPQETSNFHTRYMEIIHI